MLPSDFIDLLIESIFSQGQKALHHGNPNCWEMKRDETIH